MPPVKAERTAASASAWVTSEHGSIFDGEGAVPELVVSAGLEPPFDSGGELNFCDQAQNGDHGNAELKNGPNPTLHQPSPPHDPFPAQGQIAEPPAPSWCIDLCMAI